MTENEFAERIIHLEHEAGTMFKAFFNDCNMSEAGSCKDQTLILTGFFTAFRGKLGDLANSVPLKFDT